MDSHHLLGEKFHILELLQKYTL